MRVLVTGATGFLGRHVVRAIAARGHVVRALVRPSRELAADVFPWGVETVVGDLRLRKTLPAALDDVHVVVHLAASVVGDDETRFVNTVVGTENLLEAMVSTGVSHIVHCSSFSVYDWQAAGRVVDETTPLEHDLYIRDSYAVAKTWQERLVRRYASQHDWQLTVFRPGFIWGRGNEYLAGMGHSFGPCHVVFSGHRPLPITYVENCAECFAIAVDDDPRQSEIFNVVDDEQSSAWQFMGRVMRSRQLGGFRLPVPYWMGLGLAQLATWTSARLFRGKGKLPGLFVPCRFRARFCPLRFSNRELKARLGWRPRYDFDEAWARATRPPASPIANSAPAISPSHVAATEAACGT